MEEIVSNLKYCHTLKFEHDHSNHSSDGELQVGPLVKFPQVIYNKLNETHYQWCGPMMLIVNYLSKFAR